MVSIAKLAVMASFCSPINLTKTIESGFAAGKVFDISLAMAAHTLLPVQMICDTVTAALEENINPEAVRIINTKDPRTVLIELTLCDSPIKDNEKCGYAKATQYGFPKYYDWRPSLRATKHSRLVGFAGPYIIGLKHTNNQNTSQSIAEIVRKYMQTIDDAEHYSVIGTTENLTKKIMKHIPVEDGRFTPRTNLDTNHITYRQSQ